LKNKAAILLLWRLQRKKILANFSKHFSHGTTQTEGIFLGETSD